MGAQVAGKRATSHSSSALLARLLYGPPRQGLITAPDELRFRDYVVSLTRPGEPRMPNGVECDVVAAPRARVVIGGGRLLVGRVELEPGPEWNPVPDPPAHGRTPGPPPAVGPMSGWDPGLDSAADDLLAGYLAGLVMLQGWRSRAAQLARSARLRAGSLGATLVAHAARGEVPEPVHLLLRTGDARALLSWGRRGAWWLRGLVSAGYPLEDNLSFVTPAARTKRAV